MRITRKQTKLVKHAPSENPRHAVETLERRALLAAHIAGSSVIYSTIQAAVDAAAPNAVITVDAGVYPELVGINEPLTIRGANWGNDPRGSSRQDPSKESIVTGQSVGGGASSGFYIAASDVTIDGFTVQGDTSAGLYGAGIVIAPNQSGTHILNNIVQNNIAGLYLANASATDAALIQYNIFRYNNNAGDNSGRGIYTDGSVSGGTLQNVTIDGNFFLTNYGGAGSTGLEGAIGLEGVSAVQTNIRITNNVMEGNGKALLAFNVSNLTITGNVATGIRDVRSGTFRFEGGITNATIQNNTVYNNGGPAVRIDAKSVAGQSSGFVVTDNNFYGNGVGFENPNASIAVLGGTYSGTLDLRSNWWGSANGPSGDEAGSGDGVYVNGTDVQYSPWSTTPVSDQESPFDGAPAPTGVPIQAENFDQGGPGIGYQTGRTKNAGGAYRNGGVSIAADADVDQGYKIGSTAAGQWYAYTINVAQAGSYRIDYRLADGQTIGGRFHFEIDGVNVTGPLTAPATGSYTTYQTLSSGTFNLAAGNHILKLVMDALGNNGAVADFNWMQITPTTGPMVPTNLTLATASATELDLSWASTDASVTGFQILRSTAGGAFVQIATLGASARSYADTGLAAHTRYAYEVIAVNASGTSPTAGPLSATTPTLPGAPTNFAESVATTTSITLTWTAPVGATGYQLYRQADGGTSALIASLGGGVTSYIDTGLAAGATFQYALTGSNAGGTGAGVSVMAATKCAAPSSIFAVASGSQVTLTWALVTGAATYNIYRGTTAGGESATPLVQGITATSFIDVGLASGTTGYYIVRAVNSAGTSDASGEANSLPPTTAPSAPTLSASAGVGQIVLSWSGSTNAQSYTVYRSTLSGGEAAGLLASGLTSTQYTDSDVQPGTAYFYVVTATNPVGDSTFSDEVSATPAPQLVAPPAPVGLIVTASANQIAVHWAATTGATSYLVYRGTSPGAETGAPMAVSTNSFLDTDVAAGNTYFYQVSAVNPAGQSPRSTEASAALGGALPSAALTIGKLPVSIVAGQTKAFSQSAAYTNSSAATVAQKLATRWYLSASSTLDDAAIALPGVTKKTARMKPGTRVVIATRFPGIPNSIPAGNYYLIAQTTDSAGTVTTSVSATTVHIEAANVALEAAFAATPRSAAPARPLLISVRITNSGNVAASGALPFTVSILNDGGSVLQSLSFKRQIHLAAGKNAVIELSIKLIASVPEQIRVKAVFTPVGAIAHATGDAISLTTSAIPVITRSGAR